MQDPRLCPKCLAGRMIVRTSRRVGDSQQQRMECSKCPHKTIRYIPAASVARRML